jgi:hypothetical protein
MRMRQIKFAFLIVFAALGIAACTAVPIYNVTNAPVAVASGKAVAPTQVRQAIITGGSALGWRIVDAGPGRLEGTLNLRTHVAVVDIPYTATQYSIVYKSGENLKSADGTIHKNYNGWIQNLERNIRAELARL